MPNTKSKKSKGPSFHKDFKRPTAKDRIEALGSFPYEDHAAKIREEMLTISANLNQQPSLLRRDEGEQNITSASTSATSKRQKDKDKSISPKMALDDLNNPKLYKPTPRSETSFAIPKPNDELDWLAQVPEEGQTFEEYAKFLTTRKTGRFKDIANKDGQDILLLPIVMDGYDEVNGPSLSKLVQFTNAFFDRNVYILPQAKVQIQKPTESTSSTSKTSKSKKGRSKKKQKVNDEEDDNDSTNWATFANTNSKGTFKISFPEESNHNATGAASANGGESTKKRQRRFGTPIPIAGRRDLKSGRIQLQVIFLLDELSTFRYNRQMTMTTTSQPKDYCIMGITMIDLYDGPKDLFCAGMAFGGDKVAVFSFARYHPWIKMHPLHWYRYGYLNVPAGGDGYSYFEDEDGDDGPVGMLDKPNQSTANQKDDDSKIGDDDNSGLNEKDDVEFLRRSSKLLTHELGHLYGLDHCIHNRCLMNGTGHLVEDFRAPSHLCGICLRKLQWRLGFNVKGRYEVMAEAFGNMGLGKEKEWCMKQYSA